MDIKTITMDLRADIKWIQEELNDVKDPSLIEVFKQLLQYRKKVLQPERISIEQYNKELDESIADIEAGNYHTHEEVKSMISQWGRK